MRAYQLHQFGLDNLDRVDQETPRPGDDQVLIRFHAASLNYRDVMIVNGTYNPRMKLPVVPLSDGAGEIVEVGKNVSQWAIGDRVCPNVVRDWKDGWVTAEKARTAIGAGNYDGVLREYGAFDAESIVKVPEHLSFDEAATLPCAAVTAWHALVVSGNVQPGETVLTLGTGGVSVFAIQFAKVLGARVIATSSSDEKLERVRELGADETINYRSNQDWDKTVIELTGGVGVDHIIEVSGTGTLPRSVKAVRTGGHIALIGALDMSGEFNSIPIFMKAIRVQGIFIGSREMFEDMNAKISAAELRPLIDRTFEFDDAAGAISYMQNGSHLGKIVVHI